MPQTLGGIDVQAVTGAIVMIGGFVTAMWAGIKTGLKQVKGEAASTEGAKIVGATIMENATMTMLSDRLRDCAEAVRENTQLKRETTGVDRELAHQIERLRDSLDRR
ncbi:hypothetical protein [uncultured Sphingomonas sp.]|uniref:hypothetical protein n=1 Tax=uncultured Sphingomonas sp. TaxID=158754 RepID=UPI0025F14C1A|nr:hypothetical protein [uncultured Sphingomonas sp.]